MGCCDEIVKLGSPGEDGSNGVSCYVYIAWADDVTSGTPDVVTGFSLTTPTATSEWLAIIKTTTPIASPVAADFEDAWVKVKGADGSGSAGINIKVNNSTVTGSPFTTLDFLGAGLSGISGANAGSGEVDITIVTAGLITLTRAQALTLIGANGLIPGATYYIKDVGDGDVGHLYGGIILRAVRTDQFGLEGIFLARVPDRTTINHWSHIPTYTTGDRVEDLNEVYVANVVTTTAGLSPCLGTEWDVESKDQAYYISEIHGCHYDIVNHAILKRWDGRGNVIELVNVQSGVSPNELILQCFKWGDDKVTGNKITIDCTNAVGGWSTGRLPADQNFIPNYTTGGFRDNEIYLSIGIENFQPVIGASFELQDTIIANSKFYKSTVQYMDDGDISGCVFINNPTVYLNHTILNSTFKNSCTLSNNDSTLYISNSDFETTTIRDNINSTQLSACYLKNSSVQNNNNSNISYNQGILAFIEDNNNMTITYNTFSNGYITNNNNTVSANKASCRVTEHTLVNEAKIQDNTWNSTGIIGRGTLSGNFAVVQNLLINTATSVVTTNVLAAARTLKQPTPSSYILDMYTLENIGFDGGNLVNGAFNDTVQFPPYATENVACTPSSSSFIAYVDASTAISGGGVLTIPVWAEHAGVILLYNAPAATVTTVNLASGTLSSRYKGTRRLYKYSDAGTLTFTVTAIATPPTAGQLIGTAGALVLNRPYDFIEIRRAGSYFTVENSKIVT